MVVAYNNAMLKEGESRQGSAKLKLHYFHIRGACQPVRNLLYHLGVDFEDVLHERNKENEGDVGFNLGLPMLEDGEIRVHEAIAIMTYLCKKFEQPFLVGLTPQSIARTQEVLMKFCVQRKRIIACIFEIFGSLPTRTDKEAFVEASLRKMVAECKFLEFCLKSLGKGRAYVLETLTLVDFIFYEQCFYLHGFFHPYISKEGPHRLFLDFKQRFELLPFFQRHQQQIEARALFHEFNNPDMNRLISESWKGAKCGELLLKQPTTQ